MTAKGVVLQNVRVGRIDDITTLSRIEEAILEMLILNQEMYGLEMVRESNGKLKRGSIYVTLSRMESKGFIESRKEKVPDERRVPRRIYRATGFGEKVVRAWSIARANLAEGMA